MDYDKFFSLSMKKTLLIMIIWFLAVMFHNLLSSVLGFEEILVFTLLVFMIPVYLVIAIVYSLIIFKYTRKKR